MNNLRNAVLTRIWGADLMEIEHSSSLDRPHFRHIYDELCKNACREDQDTQVATTIKHKDILDVVSQLLNPKIHPDDVCSGASYPEAWKERCLRLAAGLLLPLNFEGSGGRRLGHSMRWHTNEPLFDAVKDYFQATLIGTQRIRSSKCTSCGNAPIKGSGEEPPCSNSLQTDVVFPNGFSAQMLAYVTGFEIMWTSNLLDHLRIDDANEKLQIHIFHQTRVLDRLAMLES